MVLFCRESQNLRQDKKFTVDMAKIVDEITEL